MRWVEIRPIVLNCSSYSTARHPSCRNDARSGEKGRGPSHQLDDGVDFFEQILRRNLQSASEANDRDQTRIADTTLYIGDVVSGKMRIFRERLLGNSECLARAPHGPAESL